MGLTLVEKKKYEQYLKRWVKDGKKLTSYVCPHCLKGVATPQPTEDLVSSKGYWDSVKVCVNCGKLSFLKVYPNGKTKVTKL